MAANTKVTLSKGGTHEKIIQISDLTIPDLFHIAQAIDQDGTVADGPGCAELILDCWHKCHSLKRHIEEN